MSSVSLACLYPGHSRRWLLLCTESRLTAGSTRWPAAIVRSCLEARTTSVENLAWPSKQKTECLRRCVGQNSKTESRKRKRASVTPERQNGRNGRNSNPKVKKLMSSPRRSDSLSSIAQSPVCGRSLNLASSRLRILRPKS